MTLANLRKKIETGLKNKPQMMSLTATTAVDRIEDKDLQGMIALLYSDDSQPKKAAATILNAIVTERKPIFTMSQPLLQTLLNTDRHNLGCNLRADTKIGKRQKTLLACVHAVLMGEDFKLVKQVMASEKINAGGRPSVWEVVDESLNAYLDQGREPGYRDELREKCINFRQRGTGGFDKHSRLSIGKVTQAITQQITYSKVENKENSEREKYEINKRENDKLEKHESSKIGQTAEDAFSFVIFNEENENELVDLEEDNEDICFDTVKSHSLSTNGETQGFTTISSGTLQDVAVTTSAVQGSEAATGERLLREIAISETESNTCVVVEEGGVSCSSEELVTSAVLVHPSPCSARPLPVAELSKSLKYVHTQAVEIVSIESLLKGGMYSYLLRCAVRSCFLNEDDTPVVNENLVAEFTKRLFWSHVADLESWMVDRNELLEHYTVLTAELQSVVKNYLDQMDLTSFERRPS